MIDEGYQSKHIIDKGYQSKLSRAVWPVRAQSSVAPEENCRTLVRVCREKSGLVMPGLLYSHGVDLISKVIKILKASLSWEEGGGVLQCRVCYRADTRVFPGGKSCWLQGELLWSCEEIQNPFLQGELSRVLWRNEPSGDSCLILLFQHDQNSFFRIWPGGCSRRNPLKVWTVCRDLLCALCKKTRHKSCPPLPKSGEAEETVPNLLFPPAGCSLCPLSTHLGLSGVQEGLADVDLSAGLPCSHSFGIRELMLGTASHSSPPPAPPALGSKWKNKIKPKHLIWHNPAI